MNSSLILFIVKLVLGGLAAFLAIMLWSRTRDAAWMSLVAGAVVSYAGVVFDMLISLGIVTAENTLFIFGLSLPALLFAVIPSVFYILAFILMLIRNK